MVAVPIKDKMVELSTLPRQPLSEATWSPYVWPDESSQIAIWVDETWLPIIFYADGSTINLNNN